MPTKLINVAPDEIQDFARQTLAVGSLEVWRIKDGRFLIHVAINNSNRGPWIELSAEQASWLAGELSK